MGLSTKIIISLVIAVVAATLVSVVQTGAPFDLLLLAAFVIACTACAVIAAGGQSTSNKPAPPQTPPRSRQEPAQPAGTIGPRETGKVKWFNVSKGFGFIIRDDGEEVFVHFRSIRGKGRRGLREGQSVSFVTAQSDKGPQAEDVEPIS